MDLPFLLIILTITILLPPRFNPYSNGSSFFMGYICYPNAYLSQVSILILMDLPFLYGGDLKPGEKTEINTDMSVFYYKLTNNGKKVFEVDALNPSSENFGDNRSFINQLLGRI